LSDVVPFASFKNNAEHRENTLHCPECCRLAWGPSLRSG
jgi:hypothetical protein